MSKIADILLVEDNQTDAELVGEALKDSNIPHTLRVATNGEEALIILRTEEPPPDLILLDLNLPKMSGLEVLREIKTSDLRTIPVIVLTNSTSDEDVIQAYQSHCNAYIRKPLGFEGFVEAMMIIEAFWISVTTLPNHSFELSASTIPASK